MDLVDIAAWLQLDLIPTEDHRLADGIRAAQIRLAPAARVSDLVRSFRTAQNGGLLSGVQGRQQRPAVQRMGTV